MTLKTKFMAVQDFATKYHLNIEHMYVQKSRGVYPKHVFRKATRGQAIYVDELFFERRNEFKTKIWNRCHTLYYFFTMTMSQNAVAKILAEGTDRKYQSWNTFMVQDLFSPITDGTILDYKVGMRHWEFYRVLMAVSRSLFRKLGVAKPNRDLEILILKEK